MTVKWLKSREREKESPHARHGGQAPRGFTASGYRRPGCKKRRCGEPRTVGAAPPAAGRLYFRTLPGSGETEALTPPEESDAQAPATGPPAPSGGADAV